MRIMLFGTGLVALAALIGMGACGGNVVVDSGTGGASVSTTNTTTTSTNNTSGFVAASTAVGGQSGASTGTGGDDVKLLCDFLCNAPAEVCVMSEPGCFESCLEAGTGACGAPFVAFLNCLQTNRCDAPRECVSELIAYQQCESSCGETSCIDSDDACSCEAICGSRDLAVECGTQGRNPTCRCYEDGQLLGFCQERDPACSLEQGCCQELFNEAGSSPTPP